MIKLTNWTQWTHQSFEIGRNFPKLPVFVGHFDQLDRQRPDLLGDAVPLSW